MTKSLRDAPILVTPMIKHINWAGVPHSFVGRCSAVCRSLKDCEDLVAWFEDPTFCPFQPVFLMIPGAYKAIAGDGYAPAAELRDVAVTVWEQTVSGPGFDFDVAREKAGLPERAKADQLIREALWDRAQRHKASPVTDPARQPWHPNPTGRTVFGQLPGIPEGDS